MAFERIGRFEIVAELERTGVAAVFHAQDPDFEGEVAIKVLPDRLPRDPTSRYRFEREAQLVSLLEEAAIVPIYEIGEIDGRIYVVMRFMPGGSLADRLRSGPLSLAEASQIVFRLAPVLDAVHAAGIVHRDLKPQNILFDDQGQAYLSDFGMDKLIGNDPVSVYNLVFGAPAYMSAEEARGEPDVDERGDIYALGAILFEMLTGQPPYQADTPVKLAARHLTDPIPDALAINPALPPGCNQVLACALAKEPGRRFASAGEMSRALQGLLEGAESVPGDTTLVGQARLDSGYSPVTPSPGRSPTGDLPGQARRAPPFRMVFYILGGIMLGLFLLGGGLLLSQAGVRQGLRLPPAWIAGMISPTPVNLLILSTSTPAPLPTVPSQTSPPPSATAVEVATILPEASSYVSPTVTGTAPMVDLPPSIGGADRLAFLNERDIWTSNLDGSDLVRLTTDGSPKTNLRWTPDGKALTYSSEGWVNMLDPATGIVSRIGQFAEFAISPDMQSVVLGDEVEFDKHVYRWQNFLLDYDLEVLHSLNLTRDSRCPFLGGRQTLFSSDSKRLAMVVETSQGERKVEAIYLLALRKCGEQPDVLDIFPGTRFTMRGYSGPKDTPVILDYDWNKDVLFVLHGNFRSGFGDLTLYNTDTTVSQVINPIEERCCYKDLRWSPDGEYLLFAYQDVRYANPAQLYYIPFGMIGTGVSFSPLPLPNYFFSDLKASLQPALREAK